MYYSKQLKNFKKIKHCFFSRKGGFSKGYYKGLNCGRGSKDSKKNILKNLRFVSKKVGVKLNNLILMNQTHSNKVVEVNEKNFKKEINSDAMVTKINGLALGVVTADCVPILLYDTRAKIVGCIHAGWKGSITNIIQNTVKKLKSLGSKNTIYASVGPCIGYKSYEVDLNFFNKFIKRSFNNKKYFKKKNKEKKLFNLRKFVADILLKEKVKIDHVNYDTLKEKKNFFSYRRSKLNREMDYGRCISIIRLNLKT